MLFKRQVNNTFYVASATSEILVRWGKSKQNELVIIPAGWQAYLDAQANACVCRSLTDQKQSSYSQKNYQKNEL